MDVRRLLLVSALVAAGLVAQAAILAHFVARPLEEALRDLHASPRAPGETGAGAEKIVVVAPRTKTRNAEAGERKTALSSANPAEQRTTHRATTRPPAGTGR